MRIPIIVLLCTMLTTVMHAQPGANTVIKWHEELSTYTLNGSEITVPECISCEQNQENGYAPYYLGKQKLGKSMTASEVSVTPINFIEKSAQGKVLSQGIPSSVSEGFEWVVKEDRGVNYLLYKFPAALKSGSNTVKLISSFKLNIKQNRISNRPKTASFANNSVLAQGEWYKIGVTADGMYRITKSDLETLGIDVNALNPQSLNIYGNGYGQLPFENSIERPDDLMLNKIVVEGEGDESFDDTDYIVFYAKGPDKWTYNDASGLFDHHKHNYVDTSYYFIGINTGDMPARVTNISSSGNPPNYESTTFNDYAFHEIDRENMLKSGRDWYGEKFDVQTTYNYSGEKYTFPNLDPTIETVVRARVLSRATVAGLCTFTLGVNGVENAVTAGPVGGGTSNFGNVRNLEVRLTNASPTLNINISYQKNAPSSTGWLDWLNINTRRKLRMTGNQMTFRDANSVATGNTTRFTVGNVSPQTQIWDVTNPTDAHRVSFNRTGDQAVFTLSTDILREFIGFNSGFMSPALFGSVQNQNLHALGGSERIDMIIVAPGLLMENAEELADVHRNYELDPLNVQVVRLEEIYNEFSSGMRDVTAIKWFMKMLYDRTNGNEALMTRYLLLFGDGSYDNKNFTPGNTNLIPTFQSANSLSPTASYVSDDYFALLSDDEGEDHRDLMDMAVGRIVAKNKQEANSVVNKIKRYVEIKPQTFSDDCTVCGDNTTNFGAWRNRIVLVADDWDINLHMSGAMSYSNIIESYTGDYNIERIFIDAFPEVATPGGARYPAVNKAIDRSVENGAFIFNYVGHGGELGLAEERILDIPMILNWGNGVKLPVFITATCEFTRYDDPLFTSAGELALLNGNGGAIALLTTTRLVYSEPNKVLNEAFYEAFFNRPEGEVVVRVGDPCREAKNATAMGPNSSNNLRNFSLIGDPALPMAMPRFKASVLSITDTLGNAVDTLKALGVVRVNGHVSTENGSVLGNFNGRLNATVFDRVEIKQTLANKSGSVPFTYPSQENVVYKGNAEVKNGLFTFDFVIPKDISFAVDSTARISLYAMSDVNDASGFIDSLKIGSRDPNAVNDGTGPELNVYMNDENFVYGGYTNETPILVATIFDENGVNTVGSGIGHDITAVIDGDESNAIVLNDYYESDLNTFKSGKIQYQFDKLEPGKHNIKLKVWDVHNNSNETEIEFVVSDNEDFSITRVLNYPNPFTTHTEFYFEHNQSCEFLNVLVQIYTVSGKLVKSINTVSNTDGFRNEPIAWDGRDDYGDRLATGVYVYKLAVRNPSGEQVEKFEKLVVLN